MIGNFYLFPTLCLIRPNGTTAASGYDTCATRHELGSENVAMPASTTFNGLAAPRRTSDYTVLFIM